MTIAYPKPRGRNHQKQVITCGCGIQFYRRDSRGKPPIYCRICKNVSDRERMNKTNAKRRA